LRDRHSAVTTDPHESRIAVDDTDVLPDSVRFHIP